jgi:hypothetical protein
MPRFHHDRLRKIGTILLVICVIAGAAWPWSYWRLEALGVRIWRGRQFLFAIEHGSFLAVFRHPWPTEKNVEWVQELPTNVLSSHSILNFVFFPFNNGLAVGVPLWLCSLLSGYYGIRFLRRAREPRPGHCTVCGYDLRATPDRCPECGAVPLAPVISPSPGKRV